MSEVIKFAIVWGSLGVWFCFVALFFIDDKLDEIRKWTRHE